MGVAPNILKFVNLFIYFQNYNFFLLNNPNIEAKLNKMRRDVRLLHKDQIKPDVSPTGKILIDENTKTEELREMVKYYYRRKKPGETR